MRIFVTGTGRCGSVSFQKACEHITNYTSGHETVNPSLEYPDNHIEVNPQFRNCLLELINKYPDSKFVHLIRNKHECVPSLAALNKGEVMQCYYLLYVSVMPSDDPLEIAGKYWETENSIIRYQLSKVNQFNKMTIRLETIRQQWLTFWDWIGAAGDVRASVRSWNKPHNTRAERGEHE